MSLFASNKGLGTLGAVIIIVSFLLALANTSLIQEGLGIITEPTDFDGDGNNDGALEKGRELVTEPVSAPIWLWFGIFVIALLVLK